MKILSLTLLCGMFCISCTSLNASFFYDDPAWVDAQRGQPWDHSVSQSQKPSTLKQSPEIQAATLLAQVTQTAQENEQLKAELAAKKEHEGAQKINDLIAKKNALEKENEALKKALGKK